MRDEYLDNLERLALNLVNIIALPKIEWKAQ